MSSISALRERISQIGRAGAIIEEMIKLGFIDDVDLKKCSISRDDIKKTLEQLWPIEQEILKLDENIKESSRRFDQLLKEIRLERIAMVKIKREEKKLKQLKEREERHQNWEREKHEKVLFLGTGVSSKLIYQGGNQVHLSNFSLPNMQTANDIANSLSLTTDDIIWLCYERGATVVDHYSRFQIPKRTGGYRIISSPKPKMRAAQLWINQNILSQIMPSEYSFAFRPGLSIVDNARQHLNKAVIIKMDIKDFFPSITFPRVRGYFEYLGYNPGVATILALLCTDAPRNRVTFRSDSQIVAVGPRSLPQGACTSPALANLIASKLDKRLGSLLKSRADEWTYTRYADDLTFSSANQQPEIGKLIGAVKNIVEAEKFEINLKKTRVMRAGKRQSVTGLVVSKDIRLHKSHIKRMRALFHNIEIKGKEVASVELGGDAVSIAKGNLAYLHMVQPKLAQKYRNKYSWLR